MLKVILIVNIAASFFMTGLIWFVQMVQYPGFLKIDPTDFRDYHGFHALRTGFVVIPPMVIELGTSIWLVIAFNELWLLNAIGLGLVVSIWIITAAFQARYHLQLRNNVSLEIMEKLISTNWIRTLFWTAKAVMGIFLLIKI